MNVLMRALVGAVVCGVVFVAAPIGGCSTTYYKTMEYFGKEKRDILAARVKDAKEDQTDAKKQFESALDRFSKLVNGGDSDLKKAYDKAKSDYESCEKKAANVHDRVKSVETVGEDLFKEWDKEIAEYSSDQRRQESRTLRAETRTRYDDMVGAMKKAEGSMDPVLKVFRDNVLSLKHNLNAQSVASLKGVVGDLQRDVGSLIREMEASIAESDKFLREMNK